MIHSASFTIKGNKLINKKSQLAMGFGAFALVAALAGCAPAATPTATPSETATAAATKAHWTYEGAEGPANWGTLDASYALCADGTAQSPINVEAPVATDLVNIKFDYQATEAGVFNNGHTVEAEPLTEGKDTITLDGVTYPFLQFHFHAPSEHEINGVRYPLEVHFVHKTTDGKIAVVGILFKEGAENKAWQPFIDDIAKATATAEDTKLELDWASLLPADQSTIRYDGSLTTPGCSEGVKWNVIAKPITMSAKQIAAFTAAYANNSRPVQALNGRKVVIDSTPSK
ncbi:MAG: hypothetical protein RL556_57 [Actinomycetota bacterium]